MFFLASRGHECGVRGASPSHSLLFKQPLREITVSVKMFDITSILWHHMRADDTSGATRGFARGGAADRPA